MILLQETLNYLDEKIEYNAIFTFDATIQSAPPNLPRNHTWHIDMWDVLVNSYQYDRYFYLTKASAQLDVIGAPNLLEAVARWRIDDRHVYFEYLNNGVVETTVDITDISGNVLLDTYRPIADESVWYFGVNQADSFPEFDNIRSIIDINVPGLNTMIGNTFDLTTTDKTIVGAINEVITRGENHNNLIGRSNPGCHPISAITNLETTLTGLQTDISNAITTANAYTDTELESTTEDLTTLITTIDTKTNSKATRVSGSVTGQLAILTSTGDLSAGGLPSQFATSAQGLKADTALQSTNIVNSLDVTASGGVLDARQGKILKDQLDSLSIGINQGSFPSYADFTTTVTNPHVNDYAFVTFIDNNGLTALYAKCKIYVPDASVADYQIAPVWSNYSVNIVPLSTLI